MRPDEWERVLREGQVAGRTVELVEIRGRIRDEGMSESQEVDLLLGDEVWKLRRTVLRTDDFGRIARTPDELAGWASCCGALLAAESAARCGSDAGHGCGELVCPRHAWTVRGVAYCGACAVKASLRWVVLGERAARSEERRGKGR